MVETPIPLLDMPEDNYTDPKFATVYSKVKSVTSLGKHDLLYSLNASSDNLFISAFTPISSLAFGIVQSMANLNRLSQSAILLSSSPGCLAVLELFVQQLRLGHFLGEPEILQLRDLCLLLCDDLHQLIHCRWSGHIHNYYVTQRLIIG